MTNRNKTILVVEDDAAVRNLVCFILEEEGHSVISAANGDEAFLASEEHAGPIHLLLIDIVMEPFMSGIELARNLIILRPEMKVVYMSGYPKEAGIRKHLETSMENFLGKPFAPDVLTAKVEHILRRAAIGNLVSVN